ncbi:MAG: prepilin peptidase [Rickettsiales bacterium]|nr:prepilin peptidase [Rickettsiales bacterium]
MDWGYVVGSSIVMTVLGLSVGNFATSLTYRLPRGLKIANDPPYCDACRTYLATRDMFPFISWVINRARCRFCGAPVPALYAFVELGCALLFNVAWFVFWPRAVDAFLVTLALGVFSITLISLHVAEKRLFTLIMVLVAGLGAVYRVLFDGGVMGFAVSSYLGFMAGIMVWGLHCLMARRRVAFPSYVIMMGVAGLCVGKLLLLPLFMLSFVLSLMVWVLGRCSQAIRGSEFIIAINLALILLVLYPQLRTLTHDYSGCRTIICEVPRGCQVVIVSDCNAALP